MPANPIAPDLLPEVHYEGGEAGFEWSDIVPRLGLTYALGENRTTYTIPFWLEYVDVCRALARDHGVSLRTLDKALWQYSKEADELTR